MTMLQINELNWETHTVCPASEWAVVEYLNGYSASCIRGGDMFYTNGGTYEIAVVHNGELVYDTPITSDVLGYLSEEQANKALKDISELPAREL